MLKHAFIKLVIIPTLCISLALTPRSSEANPILAGAALGAAAAAAGAAVTVAARQFYLDNKGKPLTLGPLGDRITAKAGEIYYKKNIGENMVNLANNQNAGTASVSPEYAYNMAKSHGSNYPELKKLIDGDSDSTIQLPSLPSSSTDPTIHSAINSNEDQYFTYNGSDYYSSPCSNCVRTVNLFGSETAPQIRTFSSTNGCIFLGVLNRVYYEPGQKKAEYNIRNMCPGSSPDSSLPIETPEDFYDVLADYSDSSGTYQVLQDELGTIVLIGIGVGAGTITDDKGKPVPLPPGYLTPKQAAQIDAQHQSDERKRAAAAAAAGAATSAAGNRVTQAELKANNAAGQLAADPTNVELQQVYEQSITELNTAEKDYADAQARQHALEMEIAQNEALELEKQADQPVEIDNTPTLKSFDWSRFGVLFGALGSVFPFNLLTGPADFFQPLYAVRRAPAFSIPLPFNHLLEFDLEIFNDIATISRWFFSILLTVTGVYSLVRWYRGVGS